MFDLNQKSTVSAEGLKSPLSVIVIKPVEAGATPASGMVSVMPERPTPATANCASTLKFHGPEVAGPETPGPAVLVSRDNGNVTSMPSGKVVTVAVPTWAN